MWQPDPGWEPVPGGAGPSTVGVWRARLGDRAVVVKRLARPREDDPLELSDPEHFAWWCRPAEVARTGAVDATPGLRAPGGSTVDEDEDGLTLVQPWVPEAGNGGLFVARCLARFTAAALPDVPWLARHQLRDRLARTAATGGWPTLARTPAAGVAARLWERRTDLVASLAQLPQVPQHGDPVPGNLPGRRAEEVLAVDWGTLGIGPVGADLGYWSLSAREQPEPLLAAYCDGLPGDLATPAQVALGARVTAVYTVFSRAEWALARAARGPGALEGKYRHPALAPHLRALQRQLPQVEALLG